MTFSWPRLTWPALALRHAAPWARKTSATSRRGRAMRPRSGGRRSAREVEAQPLQGAGDVADRVDGDPRVERRRLELGVAAYRAMIEEECAKAGVEHRDGVRGSIAARRAIER